MLSLACMNWVVGFKELGDVRSGSEHQLLRTSGVPRQELTHVIHLCVCVCVCVCV